MPCLPPLTGTLIPPSSPQEVAEVDDLGEGFTMVTWEIDADSIVPNKPYSFTVKLKIGAHVPSGAVGSVEMSILGTNVVNLFRYVVR